MLAAIPVQAQRLTLDLASDWRFLRQETDLGAKTDDWETVQVPHTWNAVDGADGGKNYYRGPAWYVRSLDLPAEWKGKRVFVRFEGVSLVADVFVNDIPIGHHRGAFAAFCFEITPYLRFDGKDTLRVRVDNSRVFDVAPLSGDFTVFGGIYRPVKLIATDTVCISPLEHGSSGVFVTTKSLAGDIEVKAIVSNGERKMVKAIVDFDGRTNIVVEIPAGETKPVTANLKIDHPRLWQGRKDPYLYSMTVRVGRDEVTQSFGIRTVELSDRGFFLNGETYRLYGVNRHQDRAGKGWAISDADHEEDHALITELGATTIRLAHYQQAEKFHELSDRTGLIVWQEIPLVHAVSGSPAFLVNARQQLTEMILQSYNHPSIAMWGLFNELDATWVALKSAPATPIIASLQKLAKDLDASRPTVGASWPEDAKDRHRVPDGIAWNIYPGWYTGVPQDANKMIDKYSRQMNGKRIGIGEYGAGANPRQCQEGELKQPEPGGSFHPQEWQNHLHETVWALLKDNPHLWGVWIWVMFDFAADDRDEGSQPGINDKGLVTYDRKTKKDTFYFYKANWSTEPVLYLASRRATPRKLATTEIKAYSNCAKVELRLNGKSLGTQKPDDIKVVRWPSVRLVPGKNSVEVIGSINGKTIHDSCEWILSD